MRPVQNTRSMFPRIGERFKASDGEIYTAGRIAPCPEVQYERCRRRYRDECLGHKTEAAEIGGDADVSNWYCLFPDWANFVEKYV